MGALAKLVALLKKLDPENNLWRAAQLNTVAEQLQKESGNAQAKTQAQAETQKIFDDNDPDYTRKLFLIEKCLFGVDIQPVALQITKLRFFIALIIDQNIDRAKDNWGIRALPNLETKFTAANTLISLPQTGAITPAELPQLEEDLAKVRRAHIAPKSRHEKKHLEKEDERLRNEIKVLMQEAGFGASFVTPIVEWNPYDQNATAPFFAPEWMFGPDVKNGFDIVIGNPPYIGEKGHKEIFRPVAESTLGKRFYMGKMDYFYFFFHVGLDVLKEGGVLAFITTNYYPTATGALKLRRDFKARAIIRRVVNFNEVRVFESAVGQHNMITVLQRGNQPEAQAFVTIENREGVIDATAVSEIVEGKAGESTHVPQSQIYKGDKDYIVFHLQGTKGNQTIHDILNAMAETGTRLDIEFNVNQGIVSGADKVSPKHLREFGIKADTGTGIFVLSKEDVSKLALSSTEAEVFKPWFKNSDIQRWTCADDTQKKVIYFGRGSRRVPRVISLLSPFKQILESRREVANGVIEWWQLQWPRSEAIFNGAKIVAPQRSYSNTFAYNEIPWFASADVYFITSKTDDKRKLKFLLGLLNSKLYYWWFYYRGKRKGEMLELYQVPIAEAPIPNATPEQQQTIASKVDQILTAKSADPTADTSTLEHEIDILVADLYGLTDEERTLVGARGGAPS